MEELSALNVFDIRYVNPILIAYYGWITVVFKCDLMSFLKSQSVPVQLLVEFLIVLMEFLWLILSIVLGFLCNGLI